MVIVYFIVVKYGNASRRDHNRGSSCLILFCHNPELAERVIDDFNTSQTEFESPYKLAREESRVTRNRFWCVQQPSSP